MVNDTAAPSVADLISVQRRKLRGFSTQFLPSLNYSHAIEYLQNWERATSAELGKHLSQKEIEKIRSVWLTQKFELPQDDQIAHLIRSFENLLAELEKKLALDKEHQTIKPGVFGRVLSIFKRR